MTRLMTYNIKHGLGMDGVMQLDVRRTSERVRREDHQEVDPESAPLDGAARGARSPGEGAGDA